MENNNSSNLKKIKIKNSYLVFLIVISLVSLSIYATYAFFSTGSTIEGVVDFNANLDITNEILEYEMVNVSPGEDKIVEVHVKNTYGSLLYYGAWYEILDSTPSDNLKIGVYNIDDSSQATGSIANGASIKLLIGITNTSTAEAVVNVGVVGRENNVMNLEEPRKTISGTWTPSKS